MYEGLTSLGLKVQKPKATFYLWAKVPDAMIRRGLLHTCSTMPAFSAPPVSASVLRVKDTYDLP